MIDSLFIGRMVITRVDHVSEGPGAFRSELYPEMPNPATRAPQSSTTLTNVDQYR